MSSSREASAAYVTGEYMRYTLDRYEVITPAMILPGDIARSIPEAGVFTMRGKFSYLGHLGQLVLEVEHDKAIFRLPPHLLDVSHWILRIVHAEYQKSMPDKFEFLAALEDVGRG